MLGFSVCLLQNFLFWQTMIIIKQSVRFNLRRSYQLDLELHYIYFKRRAAFTLRLKQISFTFVNNANMLVLVGVR